MASRLYSDCLVKIFGVLKDDHSSLHSCALVNHLWCQSAIPLLWEDPLDSKKLNGRNEKRKRYALVNTYITGLPQASHKVLIDQKIILPPVTRSPTFEYASYLRKLDLKCFFIAIQSWTEYSDKWSAKRTFTGGQIGLVIQELLRHLFLSSPRLLVLKVNVDKIGAIIVDILQNVPEARNCLASLKEFLYFAEHPTMEILFSQIAQLTGNIERFDLSIYGHTEQLINMLKAQKLFKELIINNRTNSPLGFKFWVDTDAGSVISKKASIVTYLEIENIFFPFEALSHFTSLVELNMFYCGSYNSHDWTPLSDVRLKKLKKISYKNRHSLYLESFGRFLGNAGINLSSITIRCCTICDPEQSYLLFTSIADNCQNLIHYDGPIGSDNASEFGQMLNACSQIETLCLHPSNKCCRLVENRIDFNPLLRKITIKQPWKMSKLTIIHGWKFTTDVFESFLQSRQRISKKISFYWNECEIIGNFDKVCLKYNKAGVLDKYQKLLKYD
ncbi:12856_t:CDS:1 [Dentiscutata erythropus]|uniref:12856_t:CDS:1 n=1 Tax=Dentiscutata erythropus TaxID=1348616 RepID=A0A9N8VG75_9GLOM|nr:12856_t:CDS:1 [Dentiscutata erythropus]